MKRRFDPLGTEILKNALESLVGRDGDDRLTHGVLQQPQEQHGLPPRRSASPPASWSPRA